MLPEAVLDSATFYNPPGLKAPELIKNKHACESKNFIQLKLAFC